MRDGAPTPSGLPSCRLLVLIALWLGVPATALAGLPCADPPAPRSGAPAAAANGESDPEAAGAALRAALYPPAESYLRSRQPSSTSDRGSRVAVAPPSGDSRFAAGRPVPVAGSRSAGGLLGAIDELLAPGELLGDLGHLVSAERLLVLGAGAALSGAAMDDVDELAFSALRPGAIDDVTGPLNHVGSRVILYPAFLATFAGAKLLHAPGAAQTAAQLTQAVVLSDLVVTPLKLAVGRQRPDGSNSLSYPSGHTAGAFAVATVLHRRYGSRAAIPAYTYAVLMGVARIEGRKHHLSDVIAGAVIGSLAAHTVSDRFAGRDLQIQAIAGPAGGTGIGFTLRF